MNVQEGFFYAKTHEWAKKEGSEVLAGITDHAQSELSDVVFIELPKVGRVVKQGEAVAVIESVKAAYDIYTPVSGTIARVNTELEKDPALINKDPYGKGWLFAVKDVQEEEFKNLLNKDDYGALLKQ